MSAHNLDKSHIDQLEVNIRPPLGMAITIPIDGLPGYAIYVSASAFLLGDKAHAEVERNLKSIVANLSLNL